MAHIVLDEEIPGGASFSYSFGSAVLVLFSLQALTGVMQLFYYVPTEHEAYNSLTYLRREVPFGWLIHGLHYWGAQLIIMVVGLHMARAFLWGAYKRPRELTWLFGVALFLTLMALSFTGAPLHWDQAGYWAGQVGTNIAGVVPVVGNYLRVFLRGGETMGQLALSRLFGLHVAVFPLLLTLLFGFHIVAMRRGGSVGPWKEEKRRTTGPFWPDQALKDALFASFIFFILIALVVFLPPDYSGPADRLDTSYVPKPEWNFLFLYEALKYFQGPWEPVGAVAVPGALVAILVLLPFVDRSPEKNPFRRPVAISFAIIVGAVILALSIKGYLSKGYGRAPAGGQTQARQGGGDPVGEHLAGLLLAGLGEAAQAPAGGDPKLPAPEGNVNPRAVGKAVTLTGDPERGKSLFAEICAACHGAEGKHGHPDPGSSMGHVPDLNPIARSLYSSDPAEFARNVDRFVEHGSVPKGPNPEISMPSFSETLKARQIADVIAYVMKLNGVTAAGPPVAKAQAEASSKEQPKAQAKTSPKEERSRPKAPEKTEAAPAPAEEGPPLPSPKGKANPREVGPAAYVVGSAGHGGVLFKEQCQRCHGPEGTKGAFNPGSQSGHVPTLNPIDRALYSDDPLTFAKNIDRFIQHGSVPPGPGPALHMPNFGDSKSLTQQEIANIITYVLKLNGVDRGKLIDPGVSPRTFFAVVAALYALMLLGLGGLWSKRRLAGSPGGKTEEGS
ncbi:MAG: cytochrome b N-terminal domain-containing protein [Nitrospirota bacterium]